MLRVAGPLAEVDDGGVTREVRVAPRLPGGPPVAGDRVTVDDSGTQGIIRGISPRRTVLERVGSGGRVRAVVANADLLVGVAAVAEPPLVPRLIEPFTESVSLFGFSSFELQNMLNGVLIIVFIVLIRVYCSVLNRLDERYRRRREAENQDG